MPRLKISLDGTELDAIELTKERTTVGRRPYNDVVIDNLAVSGEHAVFVWRDAQLSVEDLQSTNGTFVNGRAVQSAVLHLGDLIEIGRFQLRFETPAGWMPELNTQAADLAQEREAEAAWSNSHPAPLASLHPPTPPSLAPEGALAMGHLHVLTGVAAGRDLVLTKPVTTVGVAGVTTAAIDRRADGFDIRMLEGQTPLRVNGVPVGTQPLRLRDGDEIELAGSTMRFCRD